jgi:hypothetical protein
MREGIALYNVASVILYCAKTRQSCPHGNAPCYPTHGWWCDACFEALELALLDFAWAGIGMHPDQVATLFLHDLDSREEAKASP